MYYPLVPLAGSLFDELNSFEGEEYRTVIDPTRVLFVRPTSEFKDPGWVRFITLYDKLEKLAGVDLVKLAYSVYNRTQIITTSEKRRLYTEQKSKGWNLIVHKKGAIFALETEGNCSQFIFYQSDQDDVLIILGYWTVFASYTKFLDGMSDGYRNCEALDRYWNAGWLSGTPASIPP